jgi:hypothetical protein
MIFALTEDDNIHGFWAAYAMLPLTYTLEPSPATISFKIESSRLDLPLPMSPIIIVNLDLFMLVLMSLRILT